MHTFWGGHSIVWALSGGEISNRARGSGKGGSRAEEVSVKRDHLLPVLKGSHNQSVFNLRTRIKLHVYDAYTFPHAYYTSIKVRQLERQSSVLNRWRRKGRIVEWSSKQESTYPAEASKAWSISQTAKVPTGWGSVLRMAMTRYDGKGRSETVPKKPYTLGLEFILRMMGKPLKGVTDKKFGTAASLWSQAY